MKMTKFYKKVLKLMKKYNLDEVRCIDYKDEHYYGQEYTWIFRLKHDKFIVVECVDCEVFDEFIFEV